MNIINKSIHSILSAIYSIVGDYGLAIVGITILMRILLLPLSIKQRKSLKHQQVVNEEINKIKERYKGDTAKIKEETSKYLQANGSGMSGCLLSLLQLPIMFSLNTVIRTSFNDTATSFLLPWIPSLGFRDPYYILPVMTILIQLLPQIFPYLKCFEPLKLVRSKNGMLLYLVLINGFFAITIPSGMGLYWMISGLYSVIEEFLFHLICLQKAKKQIA